MSTKICSKCKEEKDVVEFHKKSDMKDGRQSQCKKCIATYHETDKGKAVRAKYEKTDKCKAVRAKYHKTDKVKEVTAKYRKTDKGRFVRSKASAKSRGIEFLFTLEEYTALIIESERCYYCGRSEKESNDLSGFVRNYDGSNPRILKLKINLSGSPHSSKHFTIDRLDSFGPYSDENCVCACSLCNEAKGWMINAKSWKKMANDVIDEITESCVDAGFDKES